MTALTVAVPLAATGAVLTAPAASAAAPQRTWVTVVNNGENPPGAAIHFNSYSQPSVSSNGVVAFRGRTQGNDGGGGEGEGDVSALAADGGGSGGVGNPVRGVFSRDMAVAGSSVVAVAQTAGLVPQPNNLDGRFNEFPSFPRITSDGSSIVTRGQSTPVWTYTLEDGSDTRIGTSGVYVTVNGTLTTGASLLGAVPEYGYWAVPNAPAGTRFDQFPASPTADGSKVVFKGNYAGSADDELTGDYFRDLSQPDSPVTLIAGSTTAIPNQPPGGAVTFGSTAPPSAANGYAVFTGWDNEDNPTMGGIYLAPLTASPTLETIASIGQPVPGEDAGQTFTNFGEGLSFDGRYVAFWGRWGTEVRNVVLACPTDGNKDLLAYCREQYPDGYPASIPVHQGIFVYDTATGHLTAVAKTGTQFTDFTYWVFSGAPPGVGGTTDTTREPPRWRSSAFDAVSGDNGTFQVAFKATSTDGAIGIHLAQGSGETPAVVPIVDTAMPGRSVDPQAPDGSLVSAVGIERDGFRGRNLAVTVTMLNLATSESWAGVYLTTVAADETAQTITFGSTPPTDPVPGGSYALAATTNAGLPVTFSLDAATTPGACTLSGSTVHFLAPGTCVINADQPGDGTYAAAARVQQTMSIGKAATTLALVVTASTIQGTVKPVAPSTGTPTGTVTFTVDGTSVGTATLSAGIAIRKYVVPSGAARKVTASYAGNATFGPSSAAMTRYDPVITAKVSSAHPKTAYGWYRSPVTITYVCVPHGAPLVGPCRAPVTLRHDGAKQSVTRSVSATDGGKATVSVRNINIDQVRPWVAVTGVRNGAVYFGTSPTPRCIGADWLSGLASCKVTRATRGERTNYTATATDRAGNVASASGSYITLSAGLLGAPYIFGLFDVTSRHAYTLVVYSATRPVLYRAVPYPGIPFVPDKAFNAAGYHRWTTTVYVGTWLRAHPYWNLGVRTGNMLRIMPIHVR